MSKDERSTGFLSKVARFVLHPTVSWSELDAKLPGTGTDQDRAVLKAAIERKRRNDFVRKREFDMLRAALKERQAQQAGAEAPGRSSVFPSTGGGQGGVKEKTIEKIAQIEAQMSQHWWQNKRADGSSGDGGLRIGADANNVAVQWQKTVPSHLQARPGSTDWGDDTHGPHEDDSEWGKTLPPPDATDPMPIDMLSTINTRPDAIRQVGPGGGEGSEASLAVVEEAAVQFAGGAVQAAEELLLTATRLEGPREVGRAVWQGWLDCLHAKGDVAGFEDRAAEYAEIFGGKEPEWPGHVVAGDAGLAVAAQDEPPWVCPVLLDRAAVDDLSRYLERTPSQKVLDWGALVSADLVAAQALLTLLEAWSGRDVAFRFTGAGVLRRRLKGSTPSGRRENDPTWWRLRLAVLRLMGRVEEFDLAALDFCVTYGVVPPTWSAVPARYEGVDALSAVSEVDTVLEAPATDASEPIKPLVTQLGGLDVLEWPALAPDSRQMDVPDMLDPSGQAEELFAAPALTGVLAGDISVPLGKLDAQLRHHVPGGPFVIDCKHLVRMDLAAAGHLMQWLMGVGARGISVELREAGRLVSAFLHVVGVDETVPVLLRKY